MGVIFLQLTFSVAVFTYVSEISFGGVWVLFNKGSVGSGSICLNSSYAMLVTSVGVRCYHFCATVMRTRYSGYFLCRDQKLCEFLPLL